MVDFDSLSSFISHLKHIHVPSPHRLFREFIPDWDHPISQEVMPYVNSCTSIVSHSGTEDLTHHPLAVTSRCHSLRPCDDITMPLDRLKAIPCLKDLNEVASVPP